MRKAYLAFVQKRDALAQSLVTTPKTFVYRKTSYRVALDKTGGLVSVLADDDTAITGNALKATRKKDNAKRDAVRKYVLECQARGEKPSTDKARAIRGWARAGSWAKMVGEDWAREHNL